MELRVASGKIVQRASLFDKRNHLTGESPQRFSLLFVNTARNAVEDGKGAQPLARGADKRRPGIEANFRPTGHPGTCGKARIALGVRYDEDVVLKDGVIAKGGFALGFAPPQSHLGLAPQPTRVDERQHGERGGGDPGSQQSQIVKRGFGRGVENLISGERGQARGFAGRRACLHQRGMAVSRPAEWRPGQQALGLSP